MKAKSIRKIILWSLAIVILLVGIIFAIGYFYFSKIVRNYVIEAVSRESKGLYKAEIRSLSLNIITGNLTIKRFSLSPDTAIYRSLSKTDTVSPMLMKFNVDQLQIRGFRILDAVTLRKIDVKRISLIGPEITVYRMKMPPQSSEEKHKKKMTSIPLPKGLNSLELMEFIVKDAKLEFIDCSKDTITKNLFPTCNILIKHILVDSVHTGMNRLFNADDISITLGEFNLTMKNGMNKISFREIGLSTGSGEVYVRKFHLEPLYNKHDYTRKLGFQTDWLDIRIDKLIFQRIDFHTLLFEGKVHAGLLRIDSLNLEDYRDKRVAPIPGFKPPMPQDGIRNLKTYLLIDTIMLNGGKAMYAEQTGTVPGTIFFDKLSATFTALTNDSVLLNAGLVSELKGTAWLMGKGKLDVMVLFNLGDKRNSFTFSALMGSFDLVEINPMLSNLLPARVMSGRLNKLVVPMVYANDDVSKGKLEFYYNNLSVNVLDKKKTTWTKIKTGVINFAANDLIVNNDNPTKSGKMNTGVISFNRDKTKGIINFFWKSTLSGLKSTMGFNSRAQKEMIRDEKEKVAEKQQKDKDRDKDKKKKK